MCLICGRGANIEPMHFFSSAHAERRRFPADINLTSLVDIIFNLLLFFMLTSSIAEHSGINLNLPAADGVELETKGGDLSIILSADGTILVNSQESSLENLGKLLSDHSKSENARVILKADSEVSHGEVVKIIDLARDRGVSNVSIVTKPEN